MPEPGLERRDESHTQPACHPSALRIHQRLVSAVTSPAVAGAEYRGLLVTAAVRGRGEATGKQTPHARAEEGMSLPLLGERELRRAQSKEPRGELRHPHSRRHSIASRARGLGWMVMDFDRVPDSLWK